MFSDLTSVVKRHKTHAFLTCPYMTSEINLSTRSKMWSHTRLQCSRNRNGLQHRQLPWQWAKTEIGYWQQLAIFFSSVSFPRFLFLSFLHIFLWNQVNDRTVGLVVPKSCYLLLINFLIWFDWVWQEISCTEDDSGKWERNCSIYINKIFRRGHIFARNHWTVAVVTWSQQ